MSKLVRLVKRKAEHKETSLLDKKDYFTEPTEDELEEIERILACDNLYDVLEVEPFGDYIEQEEELRQSYLDKCLLLNPNKCAHPNLNEALDRLTEAYDILNDHEAREHYRIETLGYNEHESLYHGLVQAFARHAFRSQAAEDAPPQAGPPRLDLGSLFRPRRRLLRIVNDAPDEAVAEEADDIETEAGDEDEEDGDELADGMNELMNQLAFNALLGLLAGGGPLPGAGNAGGGQPGAVRIRLVPPGFLPGMEMVNDEDDEDDTVPDATENEPEAETRPTRAAAPPEGFPLLRPAGSAPERQPPQMRRLVRPGFMFGGLPIPMMQAPNQMPPPPRRNLEEVYADELGQLEAMGFENRMENLRALERAGGDLQLAIALLVE
mmetsp:Transcript_7226/g.8285  ORF Transcript_7226/g.8285 Transcript_7226/m.8285 type:complete len:380 (+) Transcript_7226:215-1354(+)